MNKKFDMIKEFYDEERWPLQWVKNAVIKKWITAEEYQQITGKAYGNNEEES